MMGLGFTAPALLGALALLPLIWLILRAVPPAPRRLRFPAVGLLLGLRDTHAVARRTPWWLLALRMAGLAALVVGFAGPVLNPRPAGGQDRPLMIVIEGGWAQAAGWPAMQARLGRSLTEAARAGRPVALLNLAAPGEAGAGFTRAADLRAGLAGLAPQPWRPDLSPPPALPEGRFDTLWLGTGLDFPGRAALAGQLAQRGDLRVTLPPQPVLALSAPGGQDAPAVTVLRAGAQPERAQLRVIGPDPAGIERDLAQLEARFAAGADRVTVPLNLPAEQRNRLSRVQIAGPRHAGAVLLGDDSLRRRKVALVADLGAEGQMLLSPLHYLRQALAPEAELIEGTLEDLLPADPDILILADIAHPPEPDRLAEWVEDGGLLIRFAGPNMAGAADPARNDPLIPVRLRAGDRALGGALSWGAPRRIAPFAPGSPFAGLTPPAETVIRAQLMAAPAPELADHTLAALEDGTPLITASRLGAGQVVLFHVTASAEWSNLPISGLFVQMLHRIAAMAPGKGGAAQDLAGAIWQPAALLDGFGALLPDPVAEPLPGAALEAARRDGPSAAAPPGLYRAGDRIVALNALAPGAGLSPARWPADQLEPPGAERPARDLSGPLLALGALLLALDVLASLLASGRLRARGGAALIVLTLPLILSAPPLRAQDLPRTAPAALEAVLAHVQTGDPQVDADAAAGLRGLSQILSARSTLEPGAPMMVDLERDDLSLLTFLYWPITDTQPLPTPAAYARLNRFLAGGGMILFDTRDGDLAGLGAASQTAASLRALAAPLDIPPLEPIPEGHVLTRSFYLLQDFPGRYQGLPLWVEAQGEAREGAVNDGVTPVVIGGADWAGAWAMDEEGRPLNAVGRGFAGERQREMAYRFGVNLLMHVMTGNYKADQVHVSEILERLGE